MECPNCKSILSKKSKICEYCDTKVKKTKSSNKNSYENLDNFNQKNVDEYIATKEDFWKTFHSMLQAPYAFWREHSSRSLQEWVDICWLSPHIIKSIENLSQFPVLKGEGLVSALYGGGQLLTNYRYIYSESGQIINIPLHNILHYDVVSDKNASITLTYLLIRYLKNEVEQTLKINVWIKPEDMKAVKNAEEWNKLNDVQKQFLDSSIYELNNYELTIPKIGMLDKSPQKGCFG